jgi:hypothetical protein
MPMYTSKGNCMGIRLLIILWWLLGAVACGAQAIDSVVVTGTWGGLGIPAKSSATFHRAGDSYIADGIRVNSGPFDRLLRATREPALAKPNAANLGIDKSWLRGHVESAGKNASMLWFDQGTPAQKAFFEKEFTDFSTLQEHLDEVYGGFHTDDYPSMKLEIHLADGTSIEASTHSQNPLMLPWCIGAGSHCTKTFNAHISQALHGILPKGFTDRDRLLDGDNYGDIAPQMGLYMAGNLEREWNLIGVRDKDPDALRELQTYFTIRYADINTWNDLAFNEVPNTGKPVDENLQVILWRTGFPRNFVVEAHLLRENGVTEGLSELPEKANRYANSVLAIGWLREFFRAHPKEHAFVTYVHGTSMTDKAVRIFSQDMKATGHEDLVARVSISQKDDVLLTTGSGDQWIVLPDHSMVLWRWASLRPILKWPKDTFPAKECTDYGLVSGGCDGTLISPTGEIVH